MTRRLVTWNLQGRERPEIAAIVDVLRELDPDVVLLQEVQRAQCRRIAARLGWYREWRFKHWPIFIPAEGLAVLSPEPLSGVEHRALAMSWSFWSSRRRVAIAATVGDGPTRVVNTHLGSGVGDAERTRQARIVVEMAGSGPAAIGGDLNTRPDSAVLREFADAGFVDAWSALSEGDGATNWAKGPRTAPPTQRLDYVLLGPGLAPVEAAVPTGDEAVGRFGPISDHVPLVVSFDGPG